MAELRATLESTADGILVTDLAGRIRAFNRRFAQIWGLPESLLTERQDDAVYDWMRRSVTDPAAYVQRLATLAEAAAALVALGHTPEEAATLVGSYALRYAESLLKLPTEPVPHRLALFPGGETEDDDAA